MRNHLVIFCKSFEVTTVTCEQKITLGDHRGKAISIWLFSKMISVSDPFVTGIYAQNKSL